MSEPKELHERHSKVNVSAIQLCSNANKQENLDEAERLIRKAAGAGAELVVLPELFNCLADFPTILANAESIPGTTSDRMSRLADELGIHLCAGSICEASDVPGRGYNTALLFDDSGSLIQTYRKIHLFQIDRPEQPRLCEPDFMLPGDKLATAETRLGKVGLATCYDLRFPELFRALVDDNVEIILFPSAFTFATGQAHWHTLVRARAIENQCFFIAANQVGNHSDALRSYGHSLIVDPWGSELAHADGEGACAINGQLDRTFLQKVRAEIPALNNRVHQYDS